MLKSPLTSVLKEKFVQPLKIKKYDVVSLLYLWWAKKPVLSMKY